MNHGTKINWTHFPGYKGETWNPITGCSPVSIGCENCYAERISRRFGWPWGKPIFHPGRLEQPSHWKKPRAIFVCSMSDLFHDDVNGRWINLVWNQIINNPRHIFLILTKRPKMMLDWTQAASCLKMWPIDEIWPDNVYLGVTAENQQTADERIPILLKTPCAHRFVSFEPLLSDIPDVDLTGISWTICGGESGPGARPMHPDWARGLRDQCQTTGVPFFFKQWGEWIPHSQIESCTGAVYNWQNAQARECTIVDERFYKVGKKNAGRLLDGREWNEFPEVAVAN